MSGQDTAAVRVPTAPMLAVMTSALARTSAMNPAVTDLVSREIVRR